MGDRIRRELSFERREMLEKQRCQETIFSEREQVLLMQRIHIRLGIFVNDAVGDDDRSPLIGGTNAVDRETTGKTSD